MDFGFRILCQPEIRKLLWLMGITAAAVLALQYIEVPFGNVWSAFISGGSSPDLGTLGHNVPFDGLNPASTNLISRTPNDSAYSSAKSGTGKTNEMVGQTRGSHNDPYHNYVSKRNVSLNTVSGSVDNQTSFEDLAGANKTIAFLNLRDSRNETVPKKTSKPEVIMPSKNASTFSTSVGSAEVKDHALHTGKNMSSNSSLIPHSYASPPRGSLSDETFSTKNNSNLTTVVIAANANSSSVHEGAGAKLLVKNTPGAQSIPNGLLNVTHSSSSLTAAPLVQDKLRKSRSVVTISDMNKLLQQSRVSHQTMRPRSSSPVDQEMLYAKSQIENAPIIRQDKELYPSLYRNLSMFKRSYTLMETMLKVYIYREGKKPVFHQPQAVLDGIYASEGWFMKQMESNRHFVTDNARTAHLFYLPFSSRQLELSLYVPNSHKRNNLVQYLKDFVNTIATKYPFWNRTGGADHFLAACHDWAPAETRGMMPSCIRALCNADVNAGFSMGKDVSLPETYVRSAQNPLKNMGGNRPSRRPILAFFAGNMHGYVRSILLRYWGSKDPDMKIFGRMPHVKGNKNYIQHMKSSKYCICAKGYEVNSPRVVEAIFYECVPVIISDNFVPPFFEVLNWESFAVFVLEKDIPSLKTILMSIPKEKYLQMQKRVRKVQKHFLWHAEPVKYDIFHMILHSVWYNRQFQINPT